MTTTALPAAIGRYRPLELLGSGGMGSVYRAQDPLLQREVAVKVVRIDAFDADSRREFLARFRQEAQLAAGCAHPAIVGVHDFGEDERGELFIVMELVRGRSLQLLLRDGADAAGLVPMLLPVLDGLGHLHARGITHRDIKPGNIIVAPSGAAKIADFGIARPVMGMGGDGLTRVGAMLGTPDYMAPEQVDGEAVDHRADLFAVGAVLYRLLAGRPPFRGSGEVETIRRLSGPEPAPMAPLAGTAFLPLLRRALEKSPARRFQSAAEFAAALSAALAAPAEEDATLALRPARRAWDPATLQRVERALATHLGPMARVVVEQASRESSSTEELYQALAGRLQRHDRSAFLRALGGGRIEPTLGPATRGPATRGPATTREPTLREPTFREPILGDSTGAPADAGVPPAALAAAQAALAFFVGPIARVLVRDTARAAASPADFMDRLCLHVPKPEERAALRRKLAAELPPMLRRPPHGGGNL